MTTRSVVEACALAGNALSRTSRARNDCGLLVGLLSVVSAPPSNVAIATSATTAATPHHTKVRLGCRAQESASARVERVIVPPLTGTYGDAVQRDHKTQRPRAASDFSRISAARLSINGACRPGRGDGQHAPAAGKADLDGGDLSRLMRRNHDDRARRVVKDALADGT